MSQAPAATKIRPEELIRPFEGLDLDRCVANASKRLQATIATLTFDLWYQPRPPAGPGGPPRLASWLVVLVSYGPASGGCVVFDDGRPIATFRHAPPEFWLAVQKRALPPADDPWWDLAQALVPPAPAAGGEGGAR